ncbi:MAG: glycosyltransferase family 2 protein [Bacillota bacterium]|nr:glycosyltransferase family 2 protein [Bacillota bacterium]
MAKVQVLVAAMNESEDDALYSRMRLTTDAVIANQCGKCGKTELKVIDNELVIISTEQKGVGRNRNTALSYATGDILVFADEDMVYEDSYDSMIKKAFEELPDADCIIFDIKNDNPRGVEAPNVNKIRRLHIFNSMKFGAARLAVRRNSLCRANVWFSLLFGGGARYGSGEDSIFIADCIRKGLKIYTYPALIATVNQEDSTWFTGINDSYFYDKGALLAAIFPKLMFIMSWVFAFRFKKSADEFSVFKIHKLLKNGMRGFKKL